MKQRKDRHNQMISCRELFSCVRFCLLFNLVRISYCFEKTRHMTQTKARSFDETEPPAQKLWMIGLIAQSKHLT